MTLLVENLQNKINVTNDMHDILKKVIEISFELEDFSIPSEVSLLLVDNEGIREMNKTYRHIDKPTDVLSFPMVYMEEGVIKPEIGDYDMDENQLLLGDIVISMEKVKQQSEDYGHSFERELAFLATHGIFHLLGYDHGNEEKEKKMMEKQKAVLAKMGLDK